MKKSLSIIGLLLYILTGCAQFEEPTPEVQEPESIVASGQTRAGTTTFTTLPDPYSLSNMRAVYGNPNLQPTHKYVRFKPQNQEQLNRLENDYGLDLLNTRSISKFPMAWNMSTLQSRKINSCNNLEV